MPSTIIASARENFRPWVVKDGLPLHAEATFPDFNDASLKTSPATKTPSTQDQSEQDQRECDSSDVYHSDPIVIVGMGKLLLTSISSSVSRWVVR